MVSLVLQKLEKRTQTEPQFAKCEVTIFIVGVTEHGTKLSRESLPFEIYKSHLDRMQGSTL